MAKTPICKSHIFLWKVNVSGCAEYWVVLGVTGVYWGGGRGYRGLL